MKKKKKNISNLLFKEYFTNYRSSSDMYKKLRNTEGEWNEERVFSIREVLNKMKKIIENVPENKTFKIEKNKKIINIVERILEFNKQNQSRKGLKMLTPNQMLSRFTAADFERLHNTNRNAINTNNANNNAFGEKKFDFKNKCSIYQMYLKN